MPPVTAAHTSGRGGRDDGCGVAVGADRRWSGAHDGGAPRERPRHRRRLVRHAQRLSTVGHGVARRDDRRGATVGGQHRHPEPRQRLGDRRAHDRRREDLRDRLGVLRRRRDRELRRSVRGGSAHGRRSTGSTAAAATTTASRSPAMSSTRSGTRTTGGCWTGTRSTQIRGSSSARRRSTSTAHRL